MFGLTDDFDHHDLAGPSGKVSTQFAAKPDTLKWRNGYLPDDLGVELVSDESAGAFSLKKGTVVRVYEGVLTPEQAVLVFGGKPPKDAVKIPGKKGNWLVEVAPTAPNQWAAYPEAALVPLTEANQKDRYARFYLGPQDPVDLVPLSEGKDGLTDEALNALGKTTPTIPPPPPPPPKKDEGMGLGTLAVAGGLLWLLSQKD